MLPPSRTTRQRERRAKKKLLGICRDCPKEATHGRYCEYHDEKNRTYTRESKRHVRETSVERGKCVSCNNPLLEFFDDGHTNCMGCRIRRFNCVKGV